MSRPTRHRLFVVAAFMRSDQWTTNKAPIHRGTTSRGTTNAFDPGPAARRGVAVLVVLLLLAITLGLSYAMVRSQTTALQIQQNANVQASARRAALSGLAVGLKKMHTREWCDGAGVNTTLTGSISPFETYQVTYAVGDPSLAVDDSDYPYRATLLSLGEASDPSDPDRIATHRARAVVQLVPRALNVDDEPSRWQEMTEDYTVYQWGNDDFRVNVPFRIEGAVRVQHKLELARSSLWYPWYPWSSSAREDYLTHLNAMRRDGYPDLRPLTGPIRLQFPLQENGLIDLLMAMDADPINTPPGSVHNWTHPGQVSTYRIYPGGKEYSADVLGYSQQDVTWEPDPEANPLGIYCRDGSLRLYDNVTIEGTVIVKGSWDGDMYVEGANVHLKPHDLPPLYGTDRPVRLPVAVVEDDFRVQANARGSVTGLLTVWDEFAVAEDGQHSIDLTVEGTVVAKEVLICPRSEWYGGKGVLWWATAYTAFSDQEETGEPYFPTWLGHVHRLDPQPYMRIQPEPLGAGDPLPRYHWKNQYDVIYVPHEDDDGLRWDLLEWTDTL